MYFYKKRNSLPKTLNGLLSISWAHKTWGLRHWPIIFVSRKMSEQKMLWWQGSFTSFHRVATTITITSQPHSTLYRVSEQKKIGLTFQVGLMLLLLQVITGSRVQNSPRAGQGITFFRNFSLSNEAFRSALKHQCSVFSLSTEAFWPGRIRTDPTLLLSILTV